MLSRSPGERAPVPGIESVEPGPSPVTLSRSQGDPAPVAVAASVKSERALAAPGAGAEPLSGSEIYALVSPSIAFIETPLGSGSGVLIEGGYVVTNYHVAWPYRAAWVVFPDRTEFFAPVVGWDPFADLAVLGPVDASAPPLRLDDGEAMSPGSDVYLVGYPAETDLFPQPSITAGVLSRTHEWEIYGITMLQADAAIAGGQSGGALVNGFGEVVGISTWGFSEANFVVATSAGDDAPIVQALIEEYETSGAPEPPPVAETGEFEYRVDLAHVWDSQTLVFQGEAGQVLSLEIDGTRDGALSVLSPDGVIAYVDENGSSADTDESSSGVESAEVELPVDGLYLIEVSTVPGDTDLRTPSSYVLSSNVRLTPTQDPDDATQIVAGDVIEGVINYSYDVDWHSLDLTAGDTIVAWTNAIATDTTLYIASPTGQYDEQAMDDDGGPSLFGRSWNAEVVYTAPVTGEYLVIVTAFSRESGGGYFLGVNHPAAPESERARRSLSAFAST